MTPIIQSIILGCVQGLAEFLPISSSAHLILIPYFFKWEDPGLAFDVALHMGTLLAIVLFFYKDWLEIFARTFRRKTKKSRSDSGLDLWLIIIGTVPGAIIGFFLEKHAEETFRSPIIIAVTLAVFGVLLGYWDKRGKKNMPTHSFTWKDSLLVGLAQALAVIPGVSRSGITITMALILGYTRPAAMRFSFLLSAPIIAGAGLLKSRHILHELREGSQVGQMMLGGGLTSLVVGLVALWILQWLVKNRTYRPFAYYRLALSFIIIVAVVLR